jgi:hypothetical protein
MPRKDRKTDVEDVSNNYVDRNQKAYRETESRQEEELGAAWAAI